jgi:hypothetical protein
VALECTPRFGGDTDAGQVRPTVEAINAAVDLMLAGLDGRVPAPAALGADHDVVPPAGRGRGRGRGRGGGRRGS